MFNMKIYLLRKSICQFCVIQFAFFCLLPIYGLFFHQRSFLVTACFWPLSNLVFDTQRCVFSGVFHGSVAVVLG